MDKWAPITENELKLLIKQQLLSCNHKLQNIFNNYKVPFTKYNIERNSNIEEVYVVAVKDNEVMYYEDIEEGFNFSIIENNKIKTPGYEQDELKYALLHWQ